MVTGAKLSITAGARADFVAVDVARTYTLHGGMGYLRDSEVEGHDRDARILGPGGGTTEIMKEVVAALMGL